MSLRASGDREVVRLGLRRAREIAEDVHRRLTRFDPGTDTGVYMTADGRVHAVAIARAISA